jgi:DNA adenine methylase
MDTSRPIINWAGSKSAVADRLLKFVPSKFHAYFEPFAGSLSMYLAMNLSGKDVYINDSNPQLVLMYKQVKTDPDALVKFVSKLEKKLTIANADSYESGKKMFLDVREKFNAANLNSRKNMLKVAGMIIFLVQLSFGSIIYINKNGDYSAGYRAKSSGIRKILRQDAIHHFHRLLTCNKTVITNVDFEHCLKRTKAGDFVYLDPPYWSDNKNLKYTSLGFSKEDHIRLARVVEELTEKGCLVLMSYGNHPWIRQLYKNFNIVMIDVHRCSHQKRSKSTKEMIITNYGAKSP